MKSLMSALFSAVILPCIAVSPVHSRDFRSSVTTNLIWTTFRDSTLDTGSQAPGPTDPNGPPMRKDISADPYPRKDPLDQLSSPPQVS